MTIPKPKSVLSLDIGHKRVGMAGCDPLGISITALPPLLRRNFYKDLEIIEAHCLKREVQGLIVGLPLDKDGNNTFQSKHCFRYGTRLAKAMDLPIAFVNEHSSTLTVIEKYNLKKDRTGKIDSAVAAMLLNQWLKEGPELKPIQMTTYFSGQLNSNGQS